MVDGGENIGEWELVDWFWYYCEAQQIFLRYHNTLDNSLIPSFDICGCSPTRTPNWYVCQHHTFRGVGARHLRSPIIQLGRRAFTVGALRLRGLDKYCTVLYLAKVLL